MPRITGTTNAQSKFLRSFRTEPFGPGVQHWPSSAVLRRWLRRPGFVEALRSLQNTLRAQADFQLLSSAAAAAHVLHTSVTSGDYESQRHEMKAMSDLLKLAHLRERFASENSLPKPPVRDSTIWAHLRSCHPDNTVGTFLELHGELQKCVSDAKSARSAAWRD